MEIFFTPSYPSLAPAPTPADLIPFARFHSHVFPFPSLLSPPLSLIQLLVYWSIGDGYLQEPRHFTSGYTWKQMSHPLSVAVMSFSIYIPREV